MFQSSITKRDNYDYGKFIIVISSTIPKQQNLLTCDHIVDALK